MGDREGEDRTSWKPEVPFMAGSFENPVREKPVTQRAQPSATSNWLPLAKPLQHFLQHLFRGIRTGHHAVTPYLGAYSLLRHDC